MTHNSKLFRLVKLFKRNNKKMGSNVCSHGPISPEIKILKEEEIQLLMASTSMNREQIIDFHNSFLKDCPFGILTKRAFCQMFKELHGEDTKSEKIEKFSEFVFK